MCMYVYVYLVCPMSYVLCPIKPIPIYPYPLSYTHTPSLCHVGGARPRLSALHAAGGGQGAGRGAGAQCL
jgi:hypothetical protein